MRGTSAILRSVPVKTVRWGIIGCGDVTEVKSGPALARANNSALVAVMRRNGALARDYAERHTVPRWYDRAEALVDDPGVDAVYVATPPDAHKASTLLAARAGKPVYVEKPMALNLAECEEMIAACRDAGVPLFVAYYRRALPRFLAVKRWIDEGAIGTVRAVEPHTAQALRAGRRGRCPGASIPRSRAAGFSSTSRRTCSICSITCSGRSRACPAAPRTRPAAMPPRTSSAPRWSSSQGCGAQGLWVFSGAGGVDRAEILGTRGRVTYATFDEQPVVLETEAGLQPHVIPHPPHIQQPLIQAIVDELNGGPVSPSHGESAARTTRVDGRPAAALLRMRNGRRGGGVAATRAFGR